MRTRQPFKGTKGWTVMSDLFQCLDAIPEYRRAALQDALIAEWTCASAGLEGNTFSLGDTDFFLREGLTVAGKTFREHCEIKGHADALKWMEQLVITKTSLSQEHLFTLHRFIQTETVIDVYAPVGAFKNSPNGTYSRDSEGKAVWMEYASPEDVPALMARWLHFFNEQRVTRENAPSIYTRLHIPFVHIHPFADGNGRLARLISNLPLLRAGLPPIIIPKEWRQEYIALLAEHQRERGTLVSGSELLDITPAVRKFKGMVARAWERTWTVIENFSA